LGGGVEAAGARLPSSAKGKDGRKTISGRT